jgi:hypothetical protein
MESAMSEPVIFEATERFHVTGIGEVWVGPSPLDSTEQRATDFVGQRWVHNGVERTVRAVETYVIPLPVRKGQPIGIAFS